MCPDAAVVGVFAAYFATVLSELINDQNGPTTFFRLDAGVELFVGKGASRAARPSPFLATASPFAREGDGQALPMLPGSRTSGGALLGYVPGLPFMFEAPVIADRPSDQESERREGGREPRPEPLAIVV